MAATKLGSGGDPADNVITSIPNSGTCDALDVCGEAKKLCAQGDIGQSFTQLKSAAGNVYDAFFCGKPTKEPSCVPSRPAAKNMSTIYTGAITATDGDGVVVQTCISAAAGACEIEL